MYKKGLVAAYFLVFLVTLTTPSYAYLDPGGSSMLLQLFLGGMAGIAVIGRLYWNNLLTMIGIVPKDPSDETQALQGKPKLGIVGKDKNDTDDNNSQ